MDGHSLLNTFMLAVVAIFNLATAILTWRARQEIGLVRENVVTIEKATNSMKDALVASTAKASKAEGMDEERVRQEAIAAELLKGKRP